MLKKYGEKRYVFLAALNEADRKLKDIIAIAFVRIAQKGNVLAREEILQLLRFTVDQWIERYPMLWRWEGYTEELEKVLERCVRCYRFTGTFMGYVFKSLECRARGLRPMRVYSLDSFIPDTELRRIDSVVQDSETNEIAMYDRVKHTSMIGS